jgi:hypothetical protein
MGPNESARNAIKHGVRFPEAASVFFDVCALFEADPDHSAEEDRYVVLGLSIGAVVHVLRGEHIRILGARAATPLERRRYENERRG